MLIAFIFVSELVLVHEASVIAFRPEKSAHTARMHAHTHTHNTHTHTHTQHTHTYTTEHTHTHTLIHTFTHSHRVIHSQDTPSALCMRAQRRQDLRV